MAVQWDAVLTREMARELDERLRGTRLRAYGFDTQHRRVTLFSDDGCLEWRLHPNEGHVRLFPPRPAFEGSVTLKAKIVGVRAPSDERRLEILMRPAKGGDGPLVLHILLASNQRNAILTNKLGVTQKILNPRPAGKQILQVGHPYVTPTASSREGLRGDVERERWIELVEEAGSVEHLAGIAWISSLNAAGLTNADDAFALWRQLAAQQKPLDPCILTLPRGRNPYPLPLPGIESSPVASLLEAFALCEGATEAPLDPQLEARLEGALQHAKRRRGSLERELADSEDPSALRGLGDLLLARLHSVPRGTPSVTLEGFDGTPVEIELDPKCSPRKNADAIYDRAGRAARAREDLPARIGEAKDRVRALQTALATLGRGEAPDPALLAHLRDTARTPQGKAGPALPYRAYMSSNGLEIWVGRGSKSNDALTFQHARPNDVWLHARDTAGAHVVLRWNGDDAPSAQDLEEAALLAAQFSKARHSGWVPVDWTRRKYVRKPRKAAAGAVIPSRVKTVFVEPDEARAQAMAVRD